jgi:hypothetical protein
MFSYIDLKTQYQEFTLSRCALKMDTVYHPETLVQGHMSEPRSIICNLRHGENLESRLNRFLDRNVPGF